MPIQELYSSGLPREAPKLNLKYVSTSNIAVAKKLPRRDPRKNIVIIVLLVIRVVIVIISIKVKRVMMVTVVLLGIIAQCRAL